MAQLGEADLLLNLAYQPTQPLSRAVRDAVRTTLSLTRIWYLWAVVAACARWVWSSRALSGTREGTQHMSLTLARVAVLTALPIAPIGPVGPISVDAFGPVPDVIDRARSGDRAAFAELYDAHVDSVYRYLLYR